MVTFIRKAGMPLESIIYVYHHLGVLFKKNKVIFWKRVKFPTRFKEKSTTTKSVHILIPREKVVLLSWQKASETFRHLTTIFSKEQLHIFVDCETLYLSMYLNIVLWLIYYENSSRKVTGSKLRSTNIPCLFPYFSIFFYEI